MPHRQHLLAATLLLALATPLHAQRGRADLRYAAPLPDSITYVSADSIWSTISGMPGMGDIATTMGVRATVALSFAPAGADSLIVTAVLNDMKGSVSTPMGDMPANASNLPPQTLRISAKGVSAEAVMAQMRTPPFAPGMDIGPIIGMSKAGAAMLVLPGRELAIGATWTDTLKLPLDIEGMKGEMHSVTHGTYAADSVVDGELLNVIDIRTEMTMTMNGSVQGMDMSQKTTTSLVERLLWNSAKHHAVQRDGTGEMASETSMPAQGMTMSMKGRTRILINAASVH